MERKPKWVKPKLIILIRAKPEEGVLQVCKTWTQVGPTSGGLKCAPNTSGAYCTICSDLGTS